MDDPITKKNQSDAAVITATGVTRTNRRAEEEAKRKKQAKRRLMLLMMALVIVLHAVGGYFLYGVMVENVSANNQQTILLQQVDQAVVKVDQYLTENQSKLDQLAKNPTVVVAFAENNKDSLNALKNSSMAQFEQPVDLKLLVSGEVAMDRDSAAPIRFAEMDLIARAEHAQPALPEAVLINNRWQINFVSAVVSARDNSVLGTLMLTLDIESLQKKLSALDSGLGELAFLQKFTNSPTQNLFKQGNADTPINQQKNIANSHWQIKFTANNTLISTAAQPPFLWMAMVLGSTLLSLYLVVMLSRYLARPATTSQPSLASPVNEVTKTNTNKLNKEESLADLYQAKDILDIAFLDQAESLLGLHEVVDENPAAVRSSSDEASVPINIFRSYDIRGIVGKDLSVELAEKIGQAVGSEALDLGEDSLIVARDGRLHSPELTDALIKGILSTGCSVINIGIVPTPLMYFATFHFDDVCSGVMVTASHNPANYNGFKIVMNNNALADQAVLALRERILDQRFRRGIGQQSFRDIIPQYIERIFSDVALASDVSIVIDAGNAVTGLVAPQLFQELGCQVTPLFCELDGSFPNHEPDPGQQQNLQALIAKIKEVNADIGVAFDGDGDRLVVVTPKGDIIWPDRLLMLFAKDVLARNPGADVLFDVKCSRQLNQVISGYGGRPIMWKTGHSPMKAKMLETGALIGGEYSGHIFIKDRWYGFDDGIYAMARLLEIITLRDQKIDEIFEAFPPLVVTPEIKIAISDKEKFTFMEKLSQSGDFQNANITTIDGLRADYSKGWGLVRASNTSPALTLRFEAENEKALLTIQQIFKRELLKIDSTLDLCF